LNGEHFKTRYWPARILLKYLQFENLNFKLQIKFRYNKNFKILKYFTQIYVKNYIKLKLQHY